MKSSIFFKSGILGLFVFIFAFTIVRFSINAAWNDDWNGIEAFMTSWLQYDTLWDRSSLLISQMCEHRILYVKICTLVSYALFGEVNYRFLMLFGTAHLLILPFVFWSILRTVTGVSIASVLLPLCLIIFTIQPIENIFWAITALQPNVVLILALWAFAILLNTKGRWSFFLAVLFGFVAMFTNGNGMFLFIAALPIIILRRSKLELMVWLSVTVICFLLYFYNYETPSMRPNVGLNIKEYPHYIVANFFVFFGSIFDSTILFYSQSLKNVIAILFGFLMIAWPIFLIMVFLYVHLFRSRKIPKWALYIHGKIIIKPLLNLFCLASFLFTSLSSAAFAVSRASQGIEVAFSSRYKSVSLILLCVILLSGLNFFEIKQYKKYTIYVTLFALIFNLFSYFSAWDEMVNYHKFKAAIESNVLSNGRHYYYAFGEGSRHPDDHSPINTYQILDKPKLDYAGFVPGVMKYVNDVLFISRTHFRNYTPPQEVLDFKQQLFENQEIVKENNVEKVSVVKEGLVYDIEINNGFVPAFDKFDGYYALVEGDAARLCFPLISSANKLSTFITSGHYFNSSIKGQVVEPDIPIGTFTLKIGKLQDGTFRILYQQEIVVK